jgi:hypothetical protein
VSVFQESPRLVFEDRMSKATHTYFYFITRHRRYLCDILNKKQNKRFITLEQFFVVVNEWLGSSPPSCV